MWPGLISFGGPRRTKMEIESELVNETDFCDLSDLLVGAYARGPAFSWVHCLNSADRHTDTRQKTDTTNQPASQSDSTQLKAGNFWSGQQSVGVFSLNVSQNPYQNSLVPVNLWVSGYIKSEKRVAFTRHRVESSRDWQVTHWHSPYFAAYYATANSYPAICADILSDGIGCIGFSWVSTLIIITRSKWSGIRRHRSELGVPNPKSPLPMGGTGPLSNARFPPFRFRSSVAVSPFPLAVGRCRFRTPLPLPLSLPYVLARRRRWLAGQQRNNSNGKK